MNRYLTVRVRALSAATLARAAAFAAFLGLAIALLAQGGLVASAGAAEPHPWQMGLQPAASVTMEHIVWFHNMLLVVITAISVFVLALLIYVIYAFNDKSNPTPTKTTHNTLVEVAWTVIPIVILLMIAVPSFKLLYFTDKTSDAEMTLKIVGHQWYWEYQYPDQGDIKFDSNMIADKDLKPGQRRLLEVDNRVVLPVGVNIRLLMTAADVIHAWKIPAFGVFKDAVPGKTNETWVRIEKEGVYYGQCSELCGLNHAFMPVAVEAVSKEKFAAWVVEAKKKFASNQDPPAAAPQIAAQPAPAPQQ